jgi:hypothetical protein
MRGIIQEYAWQKWLCPFFASQNENITPIMLALAGHALAVPCVVLRSLLLAGHALDVPHHT